MVPLVVLITKKVRAVPPLVSLAKHKHKMLIVAQTVTAANRRTHTWSAVAQLVECRTRNRESPGSNPHCYRFEVWAFSFTSRRLSRLSCINEYLAIDSGGNVSE